MLDKLVGIAALAVMFAFMAVLFGFIPDLDLALLIVVIAALAGYDFYIMLFKRDRSER